MQLAQLNIGRLRAPTTDPDVSEFMQNLDKINSMGKRMPGFVWMMEGSGAPGTGNTENSLDGDPQFVANLTVWEDAQSLEAFVWGTIHKQFYEKRDNWFEAKDAPHFVMWWIEDGHRPTLAEATARLDHYATHGDTNHAFGWAYAKTTGLWQKGQGAQSGVEPQKGE